MRRKLVLLVLTAGMLGLTPSASATIFHPPTSENFTCRASALRVSALGGIIFSEPVVANKTNDPCLDDEASALTASVPNLVRASVLNASTDSEPTGATSRASVAEVSITVGGTTIDATVLSSRASVACGRFHPEFSGSSSVATLSVGDKSYVVADEPTTINVPTSGGLLSIAVNEQIAEPTRLTQRALRVTLIPTTGLATTVVVAESIADVSGNPCD